MNDSNSIYEDASYKDDTKKHITVALSVLLALVIVGTFYFTQRDVPVPPDLAVESNIEEVEKLIDALEVSVSGYLLVDMYQMQNDGSYGSSSVRQISLNNDLESRVLTEDSATSNLSPNSPSTGAAIQYDPKDDLYKAISYNIDTDVYTVLPSPIGYNINRVFSSPTPWYIGDAFLKEVYGTVDQGDLQYWKVMAGNIETDEFVIEENATSPRWVEDGVEMVFIKTDGIYNYNIPTETSKKVFDEYFNLSGNNELSVSPGGEYIAVTMPRNNTIGLLRIMSTTSASYQEVARIESSSTKSLSPVFDSSGRFFAVMEKNTDTNQTSIVIYSTFLAKEVQRIPMENMGALATLSAWIEFPTQLKSN